MATGVLWTFLTVAGFAILEHETITPVPNAEVGTSFPQNSAIQLASDKTTLLLFLHPYCPCSRASLQELSEIVAETHNKLSVIVVFTIPRELPPGWERAELWKAAEAMPGVRIVRDQEGVEARRFGVKGSGHTLLYDPLGHLLFSGGVTPSRGNEGDNPGHTAIVSFVLNGHALVSRTPVYGCSLL